MKASVFFLLAYLLSFQSLVPDHPNKVNKYFENIYIAEVKLIDGDKQEGLKYYKKAFEEGGTEVRFIKDIHNALMLSYQTGNIHYFNHFIAFLDDFSIDTSFFQSVGYEELKDTDFASIVDRYLNKRVEDSYNIEVCSIFDRLELLDQSIRRACRDKYSGSLYYFCGEEIALLDSLILSQVKDYFHRNDFPTDSDFCSVSKNFIPPYYLIIKHNLQWCRTGIIEVLKNEVGRIHPQVLANLLHRIHNNPCDGSDIKDPLLLGFHLRLDSNLYILPVDSGRTVKANKKRSEIYLDPVEDFHRKLIFQEFNPEYVLFHRNFFPNLDLNETLEQQLKQNFKEFKVIKGK